MSDDPPLTDEELEEIKRLAFIAGGRIAPLCHRLIAEVERLRGEAQRLREMVAYIHLHIGRHVEKQLTTEQKELLYDTSAEVYGRSEWTEERWWRDRRTAMTDHAPLTGDELAYWGEYPVTLPNDIQARLFADLRAARERIKELEGRIKDCSGSCRDRR